MASLRPERLCCPRKGRQRSFLLLPLRITLSWLSPWEVFPPVSYGNTSMQSFCVSVSTHVSLQTPNKLWTIGSTHWLRNTGLKEDYTPNGSLKRGRKDSVPMTGRAHGECTESLDTREPGSQKDLINLNHPSTSLKPFPYYLWGFSEYIKTYGCCWLSAIPAYCSLKASSFALAASSGSCEGKHWLQHLVEAQAMTECQTCRSKLCTLHLLLLRR